MREGDERRFELRRSEKDAALEHAVEEARVAGGVCPLRRCVVGHRTVGEKRRQHRSDAVHRHGHTRGAGRLGDPRFHSRAQPLEPLVRIAPLECPQGREARGHGEGIARQRPRLVHLPERRDVRHQLARTAVRADREPASDDLAQAREIGPDSVARLRASPRDAEAGDHLVEDEQRAVAGAEVAQASEKARRGRDHTHVAGHWLHDERRDTPGMGFERGLDRREVVERHGQGQRGQGRRHPQAVGHAEGRAARARLDEQAVGMPVIAPVELDDDVAPGRPAREPDRAHRRLRARGHEAHHLHGRHRARDHLRHLDLGASGRPIARPPPRGLGDRLDHRRRGVAENERSPRAEEVDVGAPVGVHDARPLGALHEDRRAAHTPERAHGTVDTAGDDPLRGVEQLLGIPHIGHSTKSRAAGVQTNARISATLPSITETTTYVAAG